ncbi:tripartite tricarboxylate transporter substrate binding protein [Pseudorhodoferax sp. Leaf267]|uniref:Bug family tripartite tricarboxylate transporter substrate binding protein n=1 Tax=Pseudorhodoferax sp. Leaf267 TaxID=1736316 RepID=UPI0006F41E01|nr:tripartite tricarboxylate transporter substrate binding protein [Pseudorhodoferax sp. Leaf267]KQP20612.1 ABC transporter substrate-binding protein [Pseudorhodoferax sp. Leaf267]
MRFPSSATRRHAIAFAVAALGVASTASALAQAWPNKPIRLIVPFPPGGPTDTASRVVGQKLAERLKQPVVVENRAGASGTIAASFVAKSPADGYTIMMLATPTLLAPHLYSSVSYDTTRDFVPIATVYDLPIVMVVNPSVLPGVTSLPQMIDKAKAEAGKLNYTSSGPGSFGHLTTEMLKDLGKFDMQHVPYKGGTPAVTDLLGGQVPMMYADLVAALPHIQAGKLRAIAVGSPQRVSMLPDVKTVAEQGFPGFDAVSWGGLLAPAGTPKDIVERLSTEVKQILADKDVQSRLLNAGAIAAYQPPADMATRIRGDFDKWGKVVRDKHIVAN